MTVILYKQANGLVARDIISPTHLALVTGAGYGWSDEQIAQDAARRWVGHPDALKIELATAVGSGGLTEEEAIDLHIRSRKSVKGYLAHALVDAADVPTEMRGDRYFRGAVVWDDTEPNSCRCDMTRARAIHLEEIRRVRNEELAKEDITFMRAVEAGDTDAQATIATKKQTLRDIPATFSLDGYADPAGLKAAWPSELPARE